jgi:hypothetical protein
MHSGNLYVDHVFMLIEAAEVGAVVRTLAGYGLTESSRRSHPGLGTANVFFCFDNVFLEILWIADRAEAGGTQLGRQLMERIDGRGSGAAPFGIGFRTREPTDAVTFETWLFEPPAALTFKPIPVARSSDDSRQPLMFRAQRASRPDAWTDGKAGVRQQPAGITEVTALHFTPAPGVAACSDLVELQNLGVISLKNASEEPQMTLTMSQANGGEPRTLVLTSPLRLVGAS